MQKPAVAAILMMANYNNIKYLLGEGVILEQMSELKFFPPFHSLIKEFLSSLSEALRTDKEARQYSDIVAFAFFCRRSSLLALEKPYIEIKLCSISRGVSFHVSPSNVPINFAYSLLVGLLSGGACIVRVSNKDKPQIYIICRVIKSILENERFLVLRSYIVIVRYDHSDDLNSYFSSLCDIRIIWGGDEAISEIRKAPLPARSFDITFADRYSICVIDAKTYLGIPDKEKIAMDFYNDTYLFDQNACSSPRLILWLGDENTVENAKTIFWNKEYRLLKKKGYKNEAITVVDKYSTLCRAAIGLNNTRLEKGVDNLILRIKIDSLGFDLPQYICAGGLFYEYIDKSLDLLEKIVSRKCQTLTYIGLNPMDLRKIILEKGLLGVDRVVPVGGATRFSLVWDGYDLIRHMTRRIEVILK